MQKNELKFQIHPYIEGTINGERISMMGFYKDSDIVLMRDHNSTCFVVDWANKKILGWQKFNGSPVSSNLSIDKFMQDAKIGEKIRYFSEWMSRPSDMELISYIKDEDARVILTEKKDNLYQITVGQYILNGEYRVICQFETADINFKIKEFIYW